MPSTDPVIAELDAEIARLTGELARARDLRAWWKSRPRTEEKAAAVEAAPLKKTLKVWIKEALAEGDRYRGAELARRLLELGWPTNSQNPSIVVRNALKTMEEDGEVARDGPEYFLPPATEGGA